MPAIRKPEIKLNFKNEQESQEVSTILNRLVLNDADVTKVMDTLYTEMWHGLSQDKQRQNMTSLQMENTYVLSLLNGKEEGDFLALDLGGTNFRVLLCQLKDGQCKSISRNYNVPTPKLYGPASEVFDHLAESIYKFLSEENMLDRKLPLGFTFSFPMRQEGLKKGVLVTWTKSFKCIDGVDQDSVQLLEEAIQRHGNMQVDVVAVLNDTTGTLMAGSYLDKKCGIGLILGTGCNAAYVEKPENVDKWSDPSKSDLNQVVIDIEWGAFGDNGSLNFMKTEFDEEVDKHSNHVGSFTFEKLCAGHYIGDVVRLVLVKLTKMNVMFQGKGSEKLFQWKSFTAAHLSDIERDTDGDVSNTLSVLKELELSDVSSDNDVALVRYICSALSIRSAQVVSACLAVLLNHMKWTENVIAIDGSLYRYHPKLHDMMMEWLKELSPTVQSRIILAEDGSGRGAAFVAAVAKRLAS